MERHKAKKTGEKSELINVIITNAGQVCVLSASCVLSAVTFDVDILRNS